MHYVSRVTHITNEYHRLMNTCINKHLNSSIYRQSKCLTVLISWYHSNKNIHLMCIIQCIEYLISECCFGHVHITQISLCIYIIYLLHFLFTYFVNEISTIHFTPFSLLLFTVTIWLSKISCIQYGFNVNNYTSCTSRTCIIIHIMIDRPRRLIIAGSGPFPPQYL